MVRGHSGLQNTGAAEDSERPAERADLSAFQMNYGPNNRVNTRLREDRTIPWGGMLPNVKPAMKDMGPQGFQNGPFNNNPLKEVIELAVPPIRLDRGVGIQCH